jgi:predicted heme/steroid binding protein
MLLTSSAMLLLAILRGAVLLERLDRPERARDGFCFCVAFILVRRSGFDRGTSFVVLINFFFQFMAQKELREISFEELQKHNTQLSCWFAVKGIVYDVTPFLFEHPGGEEVLVEQGGKDATKDFEAIGHSKGAIDEMKQYAIGKLKK